MNRTAFSIVCALALFTLTLAAFPLLAAGLPQNEVRPSCGVAATPTSSSAAQMTDLLMPARSDAATKMPDFTLHYIGQCCTNNDASLCPAVAGYTSVYCAFPMCGSGLLSCVYQ